MSSNVGKYDKIAAFLESLNGAFAFLMSWAVSPRVYVQTTSSLSA